MKALFHQIKILVFILVNQTQNAWVRKIILIRVIFLNGKGIFKFKANNENINFLTQFCLGSISNEFSTTESRVGSLNGNIHDFSVDYSSIEKCDFFNINKYLMTKNNIK